MALGHVMREDPFGPVPSCSHSFDLPALSGVEVTGQYEMSKAQFAWIEVTFKNPQLQVRATPEHVVVTQDKRNSAHKWKETLFLVMPG